MIEVTHYSADVSGDEEVIRLLRAMRARSLDMRPAFDQFGSDYAAFQFFRFARSGQFVGTKRWAPLNPKYKAAKLARYGPRPILSRTGKLASSLSRRPMDVETIKPDYAEFGTSVKYAKFHQTGTRFMPKRVIVGRLTRAQVLVLESRVVDHILPMDAARALRKAAL
jgi:phage gpG-like protein